MSIVIFILSVAIIATMVISIQSLRVYKTSKLRPALLFSVALSSLSITVVTVLLSQLSQPSQILARVYIGSFNIAVLALVILAVYLLSKSRSQLLVGMLFVAGLVGLHTVLAYKSYGPEFFTANNTTDYAVGTLVLAGIISVFVISLMILMLRQFVQVLAQPLAAVRLLLMSITVVLVGLILLGDSLTGTTMLINTVVLYILTLVTILLALTSLLTPIQTKQSHRALY